MRIHLPTVPDHVRHQLRTHLGLILLIAGAVLMVVGFATDGSTAANAATAGAHIDIASWLMFGGLLVIIAGAVVRLRESQPE